MPSFIFSLAYKVTSVMWTLIELVPRAAARLYWLTLRPWSNVRELASTRAHEIFQRCGFSVQRVDFRSCESIDYNYLLTGLTCIKAIILVSRELVENKSVSRGWVQFFMSNQLHCFCATMTSIFSNILKQLVVLWITSEASWRIIWCMSRAPVSRAVRWRTDISHW